MRPKTLLAPAAFLLLASLAVRLGAQAAPPQTPPATPGAAGPGCPARCRSSAARWSRPWTGDVSGAATAARRSRGDQARQRALRRLLPGVPRHRLARRRSGRTEPSAIAARAERPGWRIDPAGRPAGSAEPGHAGHAAAADPSRRRQGDRHIHPQRDRDRARPGRAAGGSAGRAQHRRRRRQGWSGLLREDLRLLPLGC